MPENHPKLSIGLPVYNGENYLAITLDGILSQTFGDFEVVVSDNASNDRTREICEEYARKDSRIKYFRNETNIGASPNFNRTVELSRGRYFAWVAHDDMYDERFLQKCVDVLDENPDVVLSHCLVDFIDSAGRPLLVTDHERVIGPDGRPVMRADRLHIAESPEVSERFHGVLHKVNWCLQVFGIIRADVLPYTGLQRSYYGGDKVFLAEVALRGRFQQIEETLFHKRVHAEMTFYLDTNTKKKWIDAKGSRRMPQLQMLKDYTIAMFKAPMSFSQRLRCVGSIAAMVNRPGLWHKIFVPGPYNYLGINFGVRKT
jgi:glycosyltransferase involved in cell wall biosynthesis